MRLPTLRGSLVVLALAAIPLVLTAQTPTSWLSRSRAVAPGVEFYTSTDASLADPAGPTALYLLKLDPAKVTLASAHARDEILGLETVSEISKRYGAIAAVNAGFFNTRNGDPSSVLKIGGEFVSDASVAKGVVALGPTPQQTMAFDVLSAKQAIRIGQTEIAIDGVDTTRARGKLMLFTPKYHADTDTAPNGTEIIASGTPLTVREVRVDMGHTPIPRDGVVLSFGGLELPAAIAALKPGVTFSIVTKWKSQYNVPASVFDAARDIVNGAGLLRRAGTIVTDWKPEALNTASFVEARHPRTVIGVDDGGFIWLIAIDGRQPGYAGGMDFRELQRVCDRLKLRDALNLDGGGSVTMVVNGAIVNRPSDPTGPREIGDALIVTAKK